MSLHWLWRFLCVLIFLQFYLCISKPASVQFPCKPPHHHSFTFCNKSLPITTRAQSLISLLTLQEKIKQLSNNASGIPRLGIPAYEWWSESLHGIATNGPGVSFMSGPVSKATGFPQVLVTAAAFNRTLWFLIGSAIAIEARAMYNVGQAGLTFWAPNVNIFRDPRWGRGQETPGEDPMVASAYAIAYVKGLQGVNWKDTNGFSANKFKTGAKRVLVEDDDHGNDGLMVSACCKHVTAYDLESWGNFSRYSFNAVVTEQDLEDTFQTPFRTCVQEANVSCLMCSYNQVNGVPACAREDLLQKARTEWGFKGYITSDCDAVATIFEYQNYTKSPEDAVAITIKAGMDINCGSYVARHGQLAVDQGKLREENIDRALLNLFSVQLRLGLFDGDPKYGKFGGLGPENVCTTEHRTLALEAARQGIVLVKNDGKFLPLDKRTVSSLAIIGPLANNASSLGGDYTGYSCNPQSLFEGLKEFVDKTSYEGGCLDVSCNSDSRFHEARRVARKADFVVLVAGLDLSQETEDHDRVSLLLPGEQMALVSSVAAASKKPVILVLTGGGPLDVSFARDNPKIASILWIGYPGEAGPRALAEIIFGEYNPAGKLPMTWYPESFTKIPMSDMRMRSDPASGYPGRTYRFYIGDQVYGFGRGLSYTDFTYKFLSAPRKLSLSGFLKAKRVLNQREENLDYVHVNEMTSCNILRFQVQISVTNIGDVDGNHVVMLFSRVPKIVMGTPEKQLVGFDRVHTTSYKSTETSISIDPCEHLSVANEKGERVIPLGDHVLMLEDIEHYVTIVV
ncbi:putative beta-D-xylosidase 6 [Turnera subulata]|uniref:Beta-D-xylosidase 6 n=1 Tax=Turnera subulata TaxID=218843 RepID=A0A9Q0JPW6_9ROSI|nr:putative beta-D-xylosidase 6 [Turnera subulata]